VNCPGFENIERQVILIICKTYPKLFHIKLADRFANGIHGKLLIYFAGHPFKLWQIQEIEELRDMINAHIVQCPMLGHPGLIKFLFRISVNIRPAAAAVAIGTGMINMAEFAAVYVLLCRDSFRIIDPAKLNVQHPAVVFAGLVHRDGVREGTRHWLFAVAVFAGAQDIKNKREMQIVVNRYIHGINVVSLQHLPIIDIAVPDMKIIAELIELFFYNIRRCNKLYTRKIGIIPHMITLLNAGTDKCDPNFFRFLSGSPFHLLSSPIIPH
jgi:hypothetical protein